MITIATLAPVKNRDNLPNGSSPRQENTIHAKSVSTKKVKTLVATEYDKHFEDIKYHMLKINTIPTTYSFHCGNKWIDVEAKNVTYRYVIPGNNKDSLPKAEVHIDENGYKTAIITLLASEDKD